MSKDDRFALSMQTVLVPAGFKRRRHGLSAQESYVGGAAHSARETLWSRLGFGLHSPSRRAEKRFDFRDGRAERCDSAGVAAGERRVLPEQLGRLLRLGVTSSTPPKRAATKPSAADVIETWLRGLRVTVN